MYVAFKSYFVLEAYARRLGKEVINVTPGSYIDAFKRMKYERRNHHSGTYRFYRLHNKILLPFYGGQRIIDILIGNIKQACADKTIVLATTDRPQDDILAEVAREAGICCYRGDEDNVLDRFIRAAETFNLDRFIRVCSDNPFLRPDSFRAFFKEHDTRPADYIAYGFADGRPTIKSHLGLFAELTTADALRRAAAATQKNCT